MMTRRHLPWPWRVCAAAVLLTSTGCGQSPPGVATRPVQPTSDSTPVGTGALPAADEPPRLAATLIPTDSTRYPYNHAASIAELPNGDLIVAWGAGSRELGDDTVIVMSRRPAGETTWTAPVVVADRPDRADANPVLFVDDGGRARLFHVEMFGQTFCLGRVVVQTSDDLGHTWSSPRPAFDAICVMVRNPPIVTRAGRWVMPAYIQGVYASQFWLSDDHGETWRPTASLFSFPENNLQPAVVELDDGSLFALMRRSGLDAAFTWEARSRDGGATWTTRRRDDLTTPDSGLDMIRLTGGAILVAYNNSPRERTPLAVAWSADAGRTWSTPKTVEAGDPELSYPCLLQGRDGSIHLVYTHRKSAIMHAEFNPAWLRAP